MPVDRRRVLGEFVSRKAFEHLFPHVDFQLAHFEPSFVGWCVWMGWVLVDQPQQSNVEVPRSPQPEQRLPLKWCVLSA